MEEFLSYLPFCNPKDLKIPKKIISKVMSKLNLSHQTTLVVMLSIIISYEKKRKPQKSSSKILNELVNNIYVLKKLTQLAAENEGLFPFVDDIEGLFKKRPETFTDDDFYSIDEYFYEILVTNINIKLLKNNEDFSDKIINQIDKKFLNHKKLKRCFSIIILYCEKYKVVL